MNKDYVHSIMSVLRAIRGAVSEEDYPFIVLPALLLQWAEIQNKENGFDTYKEIYSPARLSATYGVTDNVEQVIDYLIKIEESQEQVYGGYISEVSAVMRNVPVRDFSEILKLIYEAGLTTKESVFGFAVEFLQHRFGTNRVSSYATASTGVIQIEKMALGEVKESDTVLDPFAGTGISTITATDGYGNIILQDNNVRMACISEIMCILRGCKARINVADSIIQGDDGEVFNKVITELPFGLKRPDLKDMKLIYYSPDIDITCIHLALSKINNEGIATVLCLAGVLFRGGNTRTDRERLINEYYIDTVIQLPQGAVRGTGVSAVILVLRHDKRDDSILIVDASKLLSRAEKTKSDFILNPENADILKDIIDNRKEVEDISCIVTVRDVADRDYSLVATQYLNKKQVTAEVVDIAPLIESNTKLVDVLLDTDKALSEIRKKYL